MGCDNLVVAHPSKSVKTPVVSGLSLLIHTYPTYKWGGTNLLTKWDEPPSTI